MHAIMKMSTSAMFTVSGARDEEPPNDFWFRPQLPGSETSDQWARAFQMNSSNFYHSVFSPKPKIPQATTAVRSGNVWILIIGINLPLNYSNGKHNKWSFGRGPKRAAWYSGAIVWSTKEIYFYLRRWQKYRFVQSFSNARGNERNRNVCVLDLINDPHSAENNQICAVVVVAVVSGKIALGHQIESSKSEISSTSHLQIA